MNSTPMPDQPLDAAVASEELAAVSPTSELGARPSGFRRTVLTAGMAAALLVAGGVAAVSAASPDPTSSPTPTASTEATDNGTTSSSTESSDSTRGDCPHDDDGDGATPDTTPTPTS